MTNDIVLYFTAGWCQPCKQMRPIVEDYIRDNPEPKIYIIDSDVEQELVTTLEIMAIPCFIYVRDEIPLKRKSGAMTKADFEDFVQNV